MCIYDKAFYIQEMNLKIPHVPLNISQALNDITRVVSTYIHITINISKVAAELAVYYSVKVFP